MTTALHVKYRPKKLKDVVGQDHVIATLEKIIERKNVQTFLFTGDSGCGKTTLARIVASQYGAEEKDVIEVDAADNTGIDAMRAIKEMTLTRPFGKSGVRALLVDECHRLSGNAWDSLLKATEEPPAHTLWLFCTTNPTKIPKTIKTRCVTFNVKSVGEKDLSNLLDRVLEKENIGLYSDDVANAIIEAADGSPRQLLVNLELCQDAKNAKMARSLLQRAAESNSIIDLCRFLLRPGSWTSAMKILEKLKEENPESVRIIVSNYMSKVLSGAKSDKEAIRTLRIMEEFSEPFTQSDNHAPLYIAVGRIVFGG